MEQMLHTTPTLSHEINNYLTIIYSQLQYIENLYKYLAKDEHWIRMKKDFSSTFLLLKGAMEEETLACATIEPTPMKPFLLQLYQSWMPRVSAKNILLSIPSEIEEIELSVNRQQLEHIFHNLLTNSYDAICKKMLHSNAQGHIHIETDLLQKSYQVRIRDNGCGMSQQQLATILNPGTSYKKEGHGIGLPLIVEIMNAIHGEIHISSSLGRGTNILLTFPL